MDDAYPPDKHKSSWTCGCCGAEIDYPFEANYCYHCGKRIDWEEITNPPEPDYDWKRDR